MPKRLSRAVLATVTSLAVLGVAPGPAAAAPPDSRTRFGGEFAGAAVSDCGTTPVGSRCTTIFISAGESRVRGDGTTVRSETLFVSVFDVLVTGPGPFDLLATQLGSAQTTDADVDISGNLRRASASAQDLAVGGLTLDIDVTWVGVGDLGASRTRERFEESGTTVRFSDDARFRDADATAVVNGTTLTEFEVFGPVSFLSRSRTTEVCRGSCAGSAL